MKKLFLIMVAASFVGFAACTGGSKKSGESETPAVEEQAPMEEPAEEMPADTASLEADTTATDGM